MNLKLSHVPVLFGGALTGAASGYLICVVARIFFPHAQDLPSLGMVFGALAGMAIVVFGVIVAASATEMPKCLRNSPASTELAQHSMAKPIGTKMDRTSPLSGSLSFLSPYCRFVLTA